ncbi:MAG: 4Fe-4S cluster-binding domain-containing protein [Anaerolineales bacterium]|nr:MAG: 4Fe-4S cluster-binding domain-containing protein [Anaerolineales bacterium]
MKLTSLHLLLTYKCNLSCDHCFVWGNPRQNGSMRLDNIHLILQQAKGIGSIRRIYFEGGEPFLYYSLLQQAVKSANQYGFEAGIVTNAFWARSFEYALTKLQPFVGIVKDLSISSDLYHWNKRYEKNVRYAYLAAEKLGIPVGTISVAQPEDVDVVHPIGQRPFGESAVMYRGRAAVNLASRAPKRHWEGFNKCPHEDLRELGRVHLDPGGNVLICEGILLGNIFENSLEEIFSLYDPDLHPVLAPLVAGGPAELVRKYNLSHETHFADACHLCYQSRQSLVMEFPDILLPAHIYEH